MLIGLVPLIFLIYFAVQIINEKNDRVQVVNNVIIDINSSLGVMEVAAQLHYERRVAFSYAYDRIIPSQLTTQFSKTDDALLETESRIPESAGNYNKYSLLENLRPLRRQITSKQLSPNEILNVYSNILTRITSISNSSVDNIPYLSSISKDLKSQGVIFQMTNYYGLMRSSVYSAALTRTTTALAYEDITKNAQLATSYWDEFLEKSDSETKAGFLSIYRTPEAAYVRNTLQEISKTKTIPAGFDAEKWWELSAKVVDDFKVKHTQLILKNREHAELLQKNEKDSLNKYIFFLTLVILLVVLIVFYTIKSITTLLLQIRAAAEKISLGESNISLDIRTSDAIGSLAKSINTIDSSNQDLSRAADAIGKGNFDIEVVPRSSKDILGSAILKMKNDLQIFAAESAEKLWIQQGLTRINDSVKGEQTIPSLSSSSLNTLIEYLGGQIGLLYVSYNDTLHYTAGYAIPSGYTAQNQIELGETMVGQSAKLKEILFLENIPEYHVKITSASGDSNPRYLAIIPLVHNDIIEGVIEIGSIKPFPSAAKALVEDGSANIAIAIHAAKSRAKLQELLEETQAQSEELQAQHSELENLNTELEAQAQKLQASEEELKVQQEELLEANQELEERSKSLEEKNQLIVERNLDIQKKAEELELSTKYKSEFLANMSHELRTPLNSILLLSRLMSENTENNLTEDQIEYAKVIQNSGNGLLSLIDEILDLSKIEAGKMDLELSDTYIKDVIGDMKSLFAPIAKQKNLEFSAESAPDTPEKIVTDKMRLEQILKNLLSNALKFTARGSVTITVKPGENSAFTVFSVKDTGIGIPADKQMHVFEAFQQADGSTRRKYGGTGLGLSISRELAKLLGGEISLVSEPGIGSEFVVTVPVNPNTVQLKDEQVVIPRNVVETPSLTPKPEPEERPKKFVVTDIPQPIPDDRNEIINGEKPVLIIEDDTNFAKALLEFTRKSGYKGLVAERGDLGIELALKYKPIAILLDIQLPVKDGWEVMEELKSNIDTRHIPVHIMSSMEVKKESLTKGAVDFINKPVAIEQMQLMFQKLEDALNRHPKKVLIIEENTKHAQALSSFLSTFNVSSEIKGSVKDGVTALKQNGLDCVILDMGIPDQNAYETLETVKQNKGLENLPIIIFTGKNLSTAEESKLKQYADSIVMKTAHSYQRILDEVALFLHLVQEKNVSEKDRNRQNVMALNEILKDKTVLIADDDVRNIFSLTKALEQVKMKVLSATDGKEALRILEENPQTDVVLMDMMMPEMDGYESTALIRQNPKFKKLPILAVTAKAMIGDREKCIKAGASDYISKPVDIDQLVSLLRVWLYDKHF